MRTDDSVVRSTARGPLLLRRSRGYVPESLALPVEAPPLLACGAELKSTFCVAKGGSAWVGHHIGDLRNWETLRSFREGVEHFERLFAVEPELVAHDLHPDYLSTGVRARARGRRARRGAAPPRPPGGLPGRARRDAARPWARSTTAPATASDGTAWGGELLVGGPGGLRARGDAAARAPARRRPRGRGAVADGLRVARPGRARRGAAAARERWRWTTARWRAVAEMAREGHRRRRSPPASGRLFDAVAALCGLRTQVTYEGQAAAELEAALDPGERGRLRDALEGTRPAGARPAGVRGRGAGRPRARSAGAGVVSARFHNGLAAATAAALARLAGAPRPRPAVLSGGVFQNRALLERTAARLERAGLRVLTPVRCRRTTAGSPTGRRPWPPRGR